MVWSNYLVILSSWEDRCLSEVKAICEDIEKEN